MTIPFIDIKAQNSSIRAELDAAIGEVINNSAFAGGPYVKKFEEEFASAHNARYCAAVSSGTAALHAALSAVDIKRGDEVIVPTNTFIATAEAVSLAGATPVFVDCDPRYYNIDPAAIERALTSKTKAIIAVHLYGQPAPVDDIKRIADQHGLILVEDCAQAHLARYNATFAGTHGVCGCFSFYPGKNLGALGEGGAVITNDQAIHDKVQAFKDHGSPQKYHHDVIGHNYRMAGLQGAALSVKLTHLAGWTEKRQLNAAAYKLALSDIPQLTLPAEHPEAEHVWHLFVVQAEQRDELQQHLKDRDIHTGIHYPVPCHLQKAYESLGLNKGSFPVAEACADRILSLPMFSELTGDQIATVAGAIKDFYGI